MNTAAAILMLVGGQAAGAVLPVSQGAWWSVPPEQCVATAAQHYGVDAMVMQAVLDVEGGKVGECSGNKNGTSDCGPAQVNTVNRKALSKILGEDRAVIDEIVAWSPCYNVFIGAWLLRREIDGAKGNVWEGVGRYHSRTPNLKVAYEQRVARAYFRRYMPEVLRQFPQ